MKITAKITVRTCVIFIALLGLGGCSTTSKKGTDDIVVKEVAPGTFVATDTIYFSSNVLIAKMSNGEVLIASSPYETKGTEKLLAWIHGVLRPTKITAINTHFHSDGTGGNDAFEKAGIEVWSSEHTKTLLDDKAAKMRKESSDMFADPKIRQRILDRRDVAAKNIFKEKDGLKLKFGGETVEVFYPGHAHSPDNVVVYLPKRKVLFGGCMVRALKPGTLGNLGHADLKKWEISARKLTRFKTDVVIPGHGDVGGAELIESTIQLATKVRTEKEQ